MRRRVVSLRHDEAINCSKTRAVLAENVSAELLNERLRLFWYDLALDVYYTFFNYDSCSDKGD